MSLSTPSATATATDTRTTIERVIAAVRYITDDQSALDASTGVSVESGFDSLDYVEVLFELEDRFDIDIPDPVSAKFKNLGDIATYIDIAVAQKEQQQ